MLFATYRRLLRVTLKTLGFGRAFFGWLVIAPLYFLFTRLTLRLDHLFFPQLKHVKVERPVFIIGHPRSGTTLLHRMLTEHGAFCSFRTWELAFPALTARRIVAPLIRRLRARRKTLVPATVGHEISIDGVEEEEFLFLHCLDTQFLLTRTPLVFDDFEHPELRLHDVQPAPHRRRSVHFFKACLKRQLIATGKPRVAAQLHFSVHRVRTLLEAFPDARFIYLQRSPLEAIPSHLSLVRTSLMFQWGKDRFPDSTLQKIFSRRYQASMDLYACSRSRFADGTLNTRNTLVLPYDALASNLKATMDRVFEFLDYVPAQHHRDAIVKQSIAQAAYTRPHAVLPLETFGLTADQVRNDLGFAFHAFQPRRPKDTPPPEIQAVRQTMGVSSTMSRSPDSRAHQPPAGAGGFAPPPPETETADLPFAQAAG